MRAINTYAVSVVRCTAGIVNWTREELETIDKRSRKMFTAHGRFHPKYDVDRLYTQRIVGDRGNMSIEDLVRKEEIHLPQYVTFSTDKLIQTVKKP
mgnify:FL=1